MINLLRLSIAMTLILAGQLAGAALSWQARIESREVVLQNNNSKYVFSRYVEFKAARDQLLLLSTKNKIFKSEWIENETLKVPNITFNLFFNLWKESPVKFKIDRTLGNWLIENEFTHLTVKKALLRQNFSINEIPKADLIWLGCYDRADYCLGLGETLANPNQLESLIPHSQTARLSFQELNEFMRRTESLTVVDIEQSLLKAHFPETLAKWFALKLMSRRLSLTEGKENAFTSKLNQFNALEIQNGIILKDFPDFEIEFTFEHLEAKVQDFIKSAFDQVEKIAKYSLAHTPYTAFEYDKGLKGWSVGPGFMFRIKRSVVKNPHSEGAHDSFIVRDSIEFLVTISVGRNVDYGIAGASLSGGPGYIKKFIMTSFAGTRDVASKVPWAFTKDLLSGLNLSTLQPRQSLTMESGWVANVVGSGNVNVLGQSKIRPQANAGFQYRWLRRSYAYIEPNGDALFGFGRSQGYEMSSQGFFRVIYRMARIPFLQWSDANMTQEGGVYRLPKSLLSSLNFRGLQISSDVVNSDETEFKTKWPNLQYESKFRNSYFNLNLVLFSSTLSKWSGVVNLKSAENVDIESTQDQDSEARKERKFYLIERNTDSIVRFTLKQDAANSNCTGWAAFEFSPKNTQKFSDASIRLSCVASYNQDFPLTSHRLAQTMRDLNVPAEAADSYLKNNVDAGRADMSWQVQMTWQDVAPLFDNKMSGWLAHFAEELKAKRTLAPEARPIVDDSQEKLLLATGLRDVLGKQSDEDRAAAFFNWITSQGGTEMFLKNLLPRLPKVYSQFQLFRPFATSPDLIEQNYSQGTKVTTDTFKIIEEKTKWLGSN